MPKRKKKRNSELIAYPKGTILYPAAYTSAISEDDFLLSAMETNTDTIYRENVSVFDYCIDGVELAQPEEHGNIALVCQFITFQSRVWDRRLKHLFWVGNVDVEGAEIVCWNIPDIELPPACHCTSKHGILRYEPPGLDYEDYKLTVAIVPNGIHCITEGDYICFEGVILETNPNVGI